MRLTAADVESLEQLVKLVPELDRGAEVPRRLLGREAKSKPMREPDQWEKMAGTRAKRRLVSLRKFQGRYTWQQGEVAAMAEALVHSAMGLPLPLTVGGRRLAVQDKQGTLEDIHAKITGTLPKPPRNPPPGPGSKRLVAATRMSDVTEALRDSGVGTGAAPPQPLETAEEGEPEGPPAELQPLAFRVESIAIPEDEELAVPTKLEEEAALQRRVSVQNLPLMRRSSSGSGLLVPQAALPSNSGSLPGSRRSSLGLSRDSSSSGSAADQAGPAPLMQQGEPKQAVVQDITHLSLQQNLATDDDPWGDTPTPLPAAAAVEAPAPPLPPPAAEMSTRSVRSGSGAHATEDDLVPLAPFALGQAEAAHASTAAAVEASAAVAEDATQAEPTPVGGGFGSLWASREPEEMSEDSQASLPIIPTPAANDATPDTALAAAAAGSREERAPSKEPSLAPLSVEREVGPTGHDRGNPTVHLLQPSLEVHAPAPRDETSVPDLDRRVAPLNSVTSAGSLRPIAPPLPFAGIW